jgi:predicted nucleic acid-binding protein
MPDNVLVDTSVWIEYFQVPKSHVFEHVTRLLKERRAFFAGIIAMELIRGARSEKELSVLESLFRSINKIVELETTHYEAGKIGYGLAKMGLTIGTVDLLISQLAIENDLSLYTQDQHFEIVAKSFPLRFYRIER